MSDQKEPLVTGGGVTPHTGGGDDNMDDLMSGLGEHTVSINRNSNQNKKLNQQTGLKNPYHDDIDEDEEQFAKQGSKNQMGFHDDMTIMQCFWEITKFATPMIFGMFVYMMVMLVNTYFIGNLNDPVKLAGVGMGNMLINVLCFAVV